jgi:hypothetical protein
MPHAVLFKRGVDVSTDTRFEDDDTVTCICCGAVESDSSAHQNGWLIDEPICPDCLRWELTDGVADA